MHFFKSLAVFCTVIFLVGLQSCGTDETFVPPSSTINKDIEYDPSEDFQSWDVSLYSAKLSVLWTDMVLHVDRYAEGMRPNATARSLAYINLAAYESVVSGMVDYNSNVEHLDGLDIDFQKLPTQLNWRLVLNAAYAEAVDHFMYNLPQDIDQEIRAFEKELEAKYSKNRSADVIENSKYWGKYVAQQVIAYAKTDAEAEKQIKVPQPFSYEPPTGEGYWTYSAEPERALFPYWGAEGTQVRTFVIAPEETTSVPPIPFSTDPNSAYYKEMLEVLDENDKAKANKDSDQFWIAEFWSDDVLNTMMSPPARQFSLCNQLCKIHRMNLAEALYLNLKLGFSLNDAAVSAWKYKYDYMVMRPSEYIREYIDADFQTNLYRLVYWPNPSFPGYPSGHSTFASASAGVFIEFFGDDVTITDITHKGRTDFKGDPRRYYSIKAMARECAFSRVPLGVHMKQDCTEGYRLGYEISDAVTKYDLKNRYYN